MDDLVNRLRTFKGSKIDNNHFTLAVSGFYQCSEDTTKCFLCQKELCGWESSDIPYLEHRSHNKECGLVNIHTINGRKKIKNEIYTKYGYFPYKIKNEILFCFYCGDIEKDIEIMKNHKCYLEKKTIRSYNNPQIFCVKLMLGQMNHILEEIMYYNVSVPKKYLIFDFLKLKPGIYSVREMLIKDFNERIKKLEEKMDCDIEECIKMLDCESIS